VNRPNESAWYRVGVPVETVTTELTGLSEPPHGIVGVADILAKLGGAAPIPYEMVTAHGEDSRAERRVVARERCSYYRDDLTGPLPFGQIEARALVQQNYRETFTPGLIASAFGTLVTDTSLRDEGRYEQHDNSWWAPSGSAVFDPATFYQAVEAVDAFGQRHRVVYDAYSLLVLDTEDPLHNHVTAGVRDASAVVTQNGNDYRCLAPFLVTDPNGNRTWAERDALGFVVKAAAMGKEGMGEGDSVGDPTTRIEYDLHRWKDTNGRQPTFIHMLARERHGASNDRWQET